jgi:hypothetical protein
MFFGVYRSYLKLWFEASKITPNQTPKLYHQQVTKKQRFLYENSSKIAAKGQTGSR